MTQSFAIGGGGGERWNFSCKMGELLTEAVSGSSSGCWNHINMVNVNHFKSSPPPITDITLCNATA